MTHTTGDERSRDDPLRVTIYPECFYNLQGLPEEGVCPECGQKYDQRAVVLYGWTPQEAAEHKRSSVSRWFWWSALLVCFIFKFWNSRRRDVFPWLWVAIIGGVALLRLLQQKTLDAPARLQVRFDANEMLINPRTGDLGFGRKRFIPWRKIGQVRVTPYKTGGYLIYVTSPYIASFLLLREYLKVVVELTYVQQIALSDRVEIWRREADRS